MYGSSIRASPGTQVTLGTDMIFVISLCYSLLLAMNMDMALMAKSKNKIIKKM
jgi:hypothetical protein